MVGILVHGDNHFVVRGPLPDRDAARALIRHWSIIQIGATTLLRLRNGDQRIAASGLSLGQNLAGNACVTFSMIGDLERAAHTYGDRGYRYAH